MDIDDIDPGKDFVKVIEDAVGSCDILIAVIGKHWLVRDDGTARQLDNPNDFVALEIGTALARGIPVIPVLVNGAHMPRLQDLSNPLSGLARRNALEISDSNWKFGVERLIKVMEGVLNPNTSRPKQIGFFRRVFLLYWPHNSGGVICRILFYFFLVLIALCTLAASIAPNGEITLEELRNDRKPLSVVYIVFGGFMFLFHRLAVLFDKK